MMDKFIGKHVKVVYEIELRGRLSEKAQKGIILEVTDTHLILKTDGMDVPSMIKLDRIVTILPI